MASGNALYEHVPGSSALTKHLWSHYKELPHFATSGELYAHARKNITVEILFTAPQISLKKSYRTKGCQLCMAEKQHLFMAFGKQKRNQKRSNLMNAKTELYGVCNCATGFSRLCSIGNRGADEVTG